MKLDPEIKRELESLRLMESFYQLPVGYWRVGLAKHINRARRACERGGVAVALRIKLTKVMVGNLTGIDQIEKELSHE